MTAVIKSVDLLKNEIEKTRQNLQQTDLTIRRFTGRDDSTRTFQTRNNNYEVNRRGTNSSYVRHDVQTGIKRRHSGTAPGFRNRDMNKDSGDDDDDDKVNISLHSAVVATNKEAKSRDDAIQEQSKDREGTARNRRMFSLLMGTLNQFREDEKKKERQERKRKDVEKKLEEKQKEETEKMKKEKQQLFQAKKQQQFKLRQLEVKMEVVQLHEEWEEQSKQLMHFIRTDAKPHIYYLPKIHNDVTFKKLEQSKKLIEAVVSKRRGMLDEEINSILRAEEENFHAEDENEHAEEGDEPPQKKVRVDKENSELPVNKGKMLRSGHRKLSQDQGEQDDSDLEFNRHESIGFDYQTEGNEQDKNNYIYGFQQSELAKGDVTNENKESDKGTDDVQKEKGELHVENSGEDVSSSAVEDTSHGAMELDGAEMAE